MIFGQRTPETPISHHGRSKSFLRSLCFIAVFPVFCSKIYLYILSECSSCILDCALSGLKISVKVLSLTFQAGLVGEFLYFFGIY